MKHKTKQYIRLVVGVFLIHVSGAISYAITMELGTPWWDILVWPPILALGLSFILWFALIERRELDRGHKDE